MPAREISVPIAYAQMLTDAHADVPSKARGIQFGLSLYLQSGTKGNSTKSSHRLQCSQHIIMLLVSFAG